MISTKWHALLSIPVKMQRKPWCKWVRNEDTRSPKSHCLLKLPCAALKGQGTQREAVRKSLTRTHSHTQKKPAWLWLTDNVVCGKCLAVDVVPSSDVSVHSSSCHCCQLMTFRKPGASSCSSFDIFPLRFILKFPWNVFKRFSSLNWIPWSVSFFFPACYEATKLYRTRSSVPESIE